MMIRISDYLRSLTSHLGPSHPYLEEIIVNCQDFHKLLKVILKYIIFYPSLSFSLLILYSDSPACSCGWKWWLVLVLVVVVRPGSPLPSEQSSPRVTVVHTRQLEQNTSTPWQWIRGQNVRMLSPADRQQVGHIQRQAEVARLVVSVLYLDCCAHQLGDPPHSWQHRG